MGNAAWQWFDLLQQHGRNHEEEILPIILLSTEVVKCVFEWAANTSYKTSQAFLFWENSAYTKYIFSESSLVFFLCWDISLQTDSLAAELTTASSRGLFVLGTMASQLVITLS